MARGQISEEDLSRGLQGLGGFGALGGAKVIKDSPFRDSRSEQKIVDVAKAPERPVVVQKAPVEPERPAVVEVKSPIAKVAQRPVPVKKRAAEPKAEGQGRRVADIYTERVTLQLSPEMRDQVDALARELQRSKTGKEERITANTVMRVAIRVLIENFGLESGETPNNEEEILRAVRSRWR